MKQKSGLRFLGIRSDNRQSKTCPELCRRIGNRKLVGLFAVVVAFTLFGAVAHAQQAGKIFRIGFLDNSTASGMRGPRGRVPARAEQAWMD